LTSIQFEKLKIQHIHTHFGDDACFISMIIHFLTGIPYSFTTHSYDIYLKPKMLAEKHKYAKFAVTISNYNKQYLIETFGINESKIHIVRCGVDIQLFKPINHLNTKRTNTLNIISVARLVETKGFFYLLKACHLLKQNYDFTCTIIGDGPLFDEIADNIEKLSLHNHVLLQGAKRHDEVLDALKNSDLFVLPCIKDKTGRPEGIPVSLMEAMAMGIIVISSTLAGIPELVQDAGIMAKPRDELSLFKAMEKVYKMSNKEKAKIALAQRRKIEKEFNLVKETKKLMRLFESA
ncbi:glycosyltransferase family 4 protein, partial [bacterium]|nr:glycosyltransferase family 4 protein [bacterium]